MRLLSLVPVNETMRRAPVPVFAAMVMTGVFLTIASASWADVLETRFVYASVAAFLGAVVGQTLRGSLLALAVAVAAALAMAFHEALMVSRPMLIAALGLAALVAPVVGEAMDRTEAWRRLVRATTAAVLAFVGAGLVILGVYSLELSAEALLGFDFRDLTRQVIVPLALGFLAPVVFLSLSERQLEGGEDRVADALGLVAQTFARLVLTPLLAIYALVLILYTVRILAFWELPNNEIGWIVPLFGVTGAVTFLAMASLPNPGRMSRAFVAGWFALTLFPVALFVIALAIRIEAYGITPSRYDAILVAAWLGMNAVAFTLGGWRADVRLLPVSLVLVLGLGAVGPWSLVPIVTRSQSDALVRMLPQSDIAGLLRAMTPPERRPICSSVEVLRKVGTLGAFEARIGETDPGLQALCAYPYGSVAADVIVSYAALSDAVRTDGPAIVWGPVNLFAGMTSIESRTEDLALILDGGTITIEAGDRVAAFDVAAALADWRERTAPAAPARPRLPFRRQSAPVEGTEPLVLSEGAISLWISNIEMVVDPEAPRLRHAAITVMVDLDGDADAPSGEEGAGREAAPEPQ
ncbi:DUF4153 domain-containing protein [Acuticoccus kandeliae]|uniref:DUF4153 domain-containing protein n=1 Tax=Acuticoccus kandeliae TaxID=2073160 RepID=UPI00196AAF5E|nr:DUF4153 domain-containing protein [Acuticoccus kandeliae]